MNRVIKHWFGVIRTVASVGVFVIGLAASTPAPALSQTYTLTDLGTLDGGPFTEAFGLNANAQIVGTSALKATIPSTGCPPRHQCVTHPDHAFSYSAGTMKDLGTLGGNFSWGTAVNSAGDVAGFPRCLMDSTTPSSSTMGIWPTWDPLLQTAAAKLTASITS